MQTHKDELRPIKLQKQESIINIVFRGLETVANLTIVVMEVLWKFLQRAPHKVSSYEIATKSGERFLSRLTLKTNYFRHFI